MHIERCSVRAVVVTELRRSVCFDSMYTGAPCGLLAYTLSLRYYVDMLSFAPVRAVHARLSRPLAAPVPAARREALLPWTFIHIAMNCISLRLLLAPRRSGASDACAENACVSLGDDDAVDSVA